MSVYETYWPCCDNETRTNAWQPDECPFCASTILRAALDQERATTLDLAMLVRKMEYALRFSTYARADVLRMDALGYLSRKGLRGSVLRTEEDERSALLSGRGEETKTLIRKVLDDNHDILEALGDE